MNIIYIVQHSQAKLESEARAVTMWWSLGDEGIKMTLECTDGRSLSDGLWDRISDDRR